MVPEHEHSNDVGDGGLARQHVKGPLRQRRGWKQAADAHLCRCRLLCTPEKSLNGSSILILPQDCEDLATLSDAPSFEDRHESACASPDRLLERAGRRHHVMVHHPETRQLSLKMEQAPHRGDPLELWRRQESRP